MPEKHGGLHIKVRRLTVTVPTPRAVIRVLLRVPEKLAVLQGRACVSQNTLGDGASLLLPVRAERPACRWLCAGLRSQFRPAAFIRRAAGG